MIILKQSTAATVKLGPFVDDSDGVTVEDGLTADITKTLSAVQLSKNGAALAVTSSLQGVADAGAPYDALGYYNISLDATDTATLGRLKIACNITGALPVWQDCWVVTEAAYNALVGGASGWAVQTYTATVGGVATEGIHCMVTTGEDGTGEVARGYSDADGEFTFIGQTGVTYYIWCSKAGVSFDNPDTEVAA